MDRFWLKRYPPGVPADVDVNRYRSLKEVIETGCQQFADRDAFLHMGHRLTYRELEQRSAHFGAWLQHRAGMKPGDRIAIMLPNVLQYPVVMYGALRVGMTVVNTNPLYTATELEHQLRDSGAEVIVVLENFAATVQEVLASVPLKRVIVTKVGDLGVE